MQPYSEVQSMPLRRQYLTQLAQLRTDRSSWDPHYRDLSEQIEPRRSRFLVQDYNRGEKKNQKIINNTPIRAKATLAAGMQAGLTNQSRPWFRFAAPTPELSEDAAVKAWLHAAENVVREVMARSNIYNAFHVLYGDIATFGTALMYIEEDDEDVIRCWVFPVGSYYLAQDSRGRVDTVFRETSMTVRQLVQEFTLAKCSTVVQAAYAEQQFNRSIPVVHVIEPNRAYEHGKIGPKGMAWKSCWFERDAPDDTQMLREKGFEEFPAMAPRWMVTGQDTYGSSPGMEALGDCRELQLLETRNAQAFDKAVNPPMQGKGVPAKKISLLPGDTTYADSMSPTGGFSPMHEIEPAVLTAFEAKIATIERRINSAFYADLWLALTRQEGTMTATEVDERRDEKLLQLGPVTDRMGDELHDPVIDRIVGICDRRGMLPPAPPQLAGLQFKIEYISSMAQAQKLIGTVAIERLMRFVLEAAPLNPDILDSVDFDKTVEEYANALGVPPALARSADAIKAIRDAKQKAKQAAAMQQQMLAGAQGAKTLSQADLSGDNALTQLLAANGSASARN